MCKDTGIETLDDYSEEEIFYLNFEYKKIKFGKRIFWAS